MVEKPSPETAPSTLAVVGRYVLPAGIFDALEHTGRGAGGEIQLTDAIASLLDTSPIDAYRFRGTRFDCGTHLGLVEATIRFALDHEKISDAARRSEEHTSELQSLMRISYAVFCLKKKNKNISQATSSNYATSTTTTTVTKQQKHK